MSNEKESKKKTSLEKGKKRNNEEISTPSIDEQLQILRTSMKSKKEMDNLVNTEVDLRTVEKRNKKTKIQESSDSDGDMEVHMSSEKKTRRRKRGVLKEKKNEKRTSDYVDPKLMEEVIEPAKKLVKTSMKKGVLDIGDKMKAVGTDRYNANRGLDDFYRNYYVNPNKTQEHTKKNIIESLSKNIDNATTTNNNLKPDEKKKKPAFDLEKDKEKFFGYDVNDEIFGLAEPFAYKFYNLLLSDFQRREKEYRIEGRESILKKLQTLKFPDPEKCTKAYCSDFLREPKGDERPCRRMEMCICVLLANTFPDSVEVVKSEEGFIAREFLLPSQQELFIKRGVNYLPEEAQLCLLCKRMWFTFLYHYYASNDIEPVEVIQDHQNEIQKEGEYDSRYCIVPVLGKKATGIIAPVVKFNAHNYVFGRQSLSPYKEPVKCLYEKNMQFFFSPKMS
jgi:hypothetical protein